MLLDALRTYEKGERKPEFKKGDKVYDSKGEYFGTVAKVSFQPLTRVHMYQFEDKGFACSALGLSKKPDGKKYKMGEIVQVNKAMDSILDDMLHSVRKSGFGSLNGTYDITGENYAIEFFQPDNVFGKWLHDYAAGRMIIDVGCGGGRLVSFLRDSFKTKICGVDPFFDAAAMQRLNMDRILNNLDMIHIFNKKIEDMGSLFQGQGNKVLLLFARPCHSRFVENTLIMKDSNTEALYITKPENLDMYCDLGKFDNKKQLIKHQGFSVEQEVVYSIR